MHTRRLSLPVLILGLCSTALTLAQTSDGLHPNHTPDRATLELSRRITARNEAFGNPVQWSAAAAVQYRIFDSLANCFSYYTPSQEPLRYDPVTGALVTIKRGEPGKSNDVYIRYSTDNGHTWTAPLGPLHDQASLGGGRYPCVVPLNLQGSSNPGDLYFYYTFPTVAGGAFGNYVWGVIDANGTAIAPAVNDPGVTPETWETSAMSVVSKDNDVLVTAGTLSNNNLGLRRLDLTSVSATSVIPPQWTADHYSNPGSPDSRTSVICGLGRDDNGVFYLGAFSRFVGKDPVQDAHPFPAYSTSSDKGQTWSDFDVLPPDVTNDYVTANGGGANPDSTFFPYWAQDFAVTSQGGNGVLHWALTFAESDAAKDTTLPQFLHIVEVQRGPGGWSMKKIADFRSYFYHIVSGDSSSNQMDNEVMIATTADGSRLVCKWIDLISYIFTDDINNDGQSPDTMTTVDVFAASRAVAGGQWGPKVNITETPLLDKCTWMPDVLPNDLSSLPMLAVQTAFDPAAGPTILDSIFYQQRQTELKSYVVAFNGDASAAAGVTDETSNARAGMYLSGPAPNPVRDRAFVTYTTPRAGHVTIDLYAVNGERIRTIRDQQSEAGNWGFLLNSSDLPGGTYYYTLSLDGTPLTRMFTVVR